MAHFEVTLQPAMSGYNLDGIEQDTDPLYIVTKSGKMIYVHEGLFQTLDFVKSQLIAGDSLSMDVEV